MNKDAGIGGASEAGPPEPPEWEARNAKYAMYKMPTMSKARTSTQCYRAAFLVALFTLSSWALSHFLLGQQSLWRPGWSETQAGSMKGSTYLLGVGKADITGYVVIWNTYVSTYIFTLTTANRP